MPVVFTFQVTSASPAPPEPVGTVSNFRRVGGELTTRLPDEVTVVPTSLEWDSYRQRTPLDGVEYQLVFTWNERSNRWVFSLYYTDGSPIVEGKVVALNTDLLLAVVDPRRPPGVLALVSSEETTEEATRDGLGDTYFVTYQRYL